MRRSGTTTRVEKLYLTEESEQRHLRLKKDKPSHASARSADALVLMRRQNPRAQLLRAKCSRSKKKYILTNYSKREVMEAKTKTHARKRG